MERPTFLDLSATNSRAGSSASTARTGHPSPRIQHYDGDVPPVLSPLDAFAAESRRLAKELEATRLAGQRRMSRLPPQVITKSLSQHHANRPACFRSLSNNSSDSLSPLPTLPRQDIFGTGNNVEVKEPSQRPKSSHPRISAVPPDEEDDHDRQDESLEAPSGTQAENQSSDYFEIRRTQSPPAMSEHDIPLLDGSRMRSTSSHSRPLSGLVPPAAPFAKNRPYHESSDDDYTSSNAGSTFSAPPRKLSNGSGMSFSTSPALAAQHERSPSAKSDLSGTSLNRSRLPFNFSRPMSQASMNLKVESPTSVPKDFLERKPSHLSEETSGFTSFEDDRSVMSDGFVARPSSSYTHKKFVLPRGKMSEKAAQRVSQLFAGLSGPTFGWQEPVFPGTPPLSARTENENYFGSMSSPTFRPSFDPGRPSLDPGRPSFDPGRPSAERAPATRTGFAFGFDKSERKSGEDERPSSSKTAPDLDRTAETILQRPFTSYNASSFDRSKMPTLPPIPGSTADDMSLKSATTAMTRGRSASTVRPTTSRSQSDYQALTPEEHVDKAIDLHQNGDLKESTYHLRIAAKQNHPTGMLLYALACRHGWGMRANPREGVALLRKAVEVAMAEVAEDEGSTSGRPQADFLEKKSHRAHFALAIYELGISHLNGWGVEQDKGLALRCFEIAGSWGDTDALTEAGFCYAEGVGCKKNLKKAAKFYRQAADKGVSMVGNSWIYKDKYNDDDDDKNKDKDRNGRLRNVPIAAEGGEKKKRDKSKTRSIFGRKRGTTVSEKERKDSSSQAKVSSEMAVS